MNNYCFVVLSCMVAAAISQRYKKIYIRTDDEVKEHEILPESNQLIYEMKSCTRSSLKFDGKYMITTMPPQGNSVRVIFKNLEINDKFAEEIIQNWPNCGEFIHFKVGLINGNLTLWSTNGTGWNVLLTSEDPFSGTSFNNVLLFGMPAEWKIYQIEHTTKPYKETCINF